MEATHTQPQIEGGPDVNAFFDSYRMGFGSARVRRLAVAEISPCIVQATVDWELLDRAGARLYTFAATYTLAKIEGALRIAALAHNEIPSYREYVSGRLAGGA